VLEAYGWPNDIDDDALLANLLGLNFTRQSAEVATGKRWAAPAEGA